MPPKFVIDPITKDANGNLVLSITVQGIHNADGLMAVANDLEQIISSKGVNFMAVLSLMHDIGVLK